MENIKWSICFLYAWLWSIQLVLAIEEKGDVTIGAILPIHKRSTDATKCGPINYEGLAVSQAIQLAVKKVNSDTNILGVNAVKRTIGYDIRDSCGSVEKGKDIAYAFNLLRRKPSAGNGNMSDNGISIVLGAFNKDQLPLIKLLSFEEIPQISYAYDNARINRGDTISKDDIQMLLSSFPEDVTKMRAVADLVSTLAFQYVHVVSSDDRRGEEGRRLLVGELKQLKLCFSDDLIVSDQQSVKKVVEKLAKNKRISVVVLHCNAERTLQVYEEVQAQNLTHLIFISTNSWRQEDRDSLKQYAPEVEGMIYIGDAAQSPQGYHQYVEKLREPFRESKYLQEAFLAEGGPKECLSDDEAVRKQAQCQTARDKVILALRKQGQAAAYAIDAVYAVAYAVEDRERAGRKEPGLLKYIQETEFISTLTGNIVRFNQEGVVLSNSFVLFSVRGNTSTTFQTLRVGSWRVQDSPQLGLNKRILLWKDASTRVPRSRCSDDCPQGTFMKSSSSSCCWECAKCPNKTISNKTNAPSCVKCQSGFTPNPSQAKCAKYEAIYFRWYEPSGECMIFFITAGLCVSLFTLGIFSQNSESPMVKNSGFKLMFFMLLGVGLTFVTPVPLFVRPSTTICCAYVVIMNFSLTIPLAVMVTKTAAFTNFFFDEDGEVKRGTLTSRPRVVMIFILLALQGVILAAGLVMLPSQVNVLETEHWDVKYLECDSHRNYIFWIGFSYNVLISVIINFLSCSATDMEQNFGELKWVCLTTCVFYLVALLYITVVFSVAGKRLVEGAGVMIILFGFNFLCGYFFPKLYYILFRSDKSKSGIEASLLMHEEEEPHVHTHSSAATPFQHHGILSMKIRDDTSDETKA